LLFYNQRRGIVALVRRRLAKQKSKHPDPQQKQTTRFDGARHFPLLILGKNLPNELHLRQQSKELSLVYSRADPRRMNGKTTDAAALAS
jgi:hypothetical protein